MKQRAPEFSALMTILRSTGPVISTATVLQVGRDRRDLPVALASLPGLREEVGELAGGDSLLPLGARREEPLPLRVEAALKAGDELERFLGQNLCVAPPRRAREAPAPSPTRTPPSF